MTLAQLLIVIAVASAAVLLFRRRPYAGIALAASALQALMAFGVVSIDLEFVSVTLALAVIIAVVGLFAYARASDKAAITAATLLVTVGGIQVLTDLGLV